MKQVLQRLGLLANLRGRGPQRRGPCPVHIRPAQSPALDPPLPGWSTLPSALILESDNPPSADGSLIRRSGDGARNAGSETTISEFVGTTKKPGHDQGSGAGWRRAGGFQSRNPSSRLVSGGEVDSISPPSSWPSSPTE